MKDDRPQPVPRRAGRTAEAPHEMPDTPQTRSPAYRLAFDDHDFLCRDELRPVRLQLELLKPEMVMAERGRRDRPWCCSAARAFPTPAHEGHGAGPRRWPS